jgi:hypothetical protein
MGGRDAGAPTKQDQLSQFQEHMLNKLTHLSAEAGFDEYREDKGSPTGGVPRVH